MDSSISWKWYQPLTEPELRKRKLIQWVTKTPSGTTWSVHGYTVAILGDHD